MKKATITVLIFCAVLFGATVNGWLDLPFMSSPANPPSGVRLYANTATGKLGCVNASGADCSPTPLANGYLDLPLISTPSNPGAGNVRLFANTSGHSLTCMDSSGAGCLSSGGSTASGGILVGGVPLTNARFLALNGGVTVNGQNDIYTAPAGKRAWIIGFNMYAGTTGGAVSASLKTGGSYYTLWNFLTLTSSGGTLGKVIDIVLEPGESFAIGTNFSDSTTAYAVQGIEFDNTVPFKTERILAAASGDNALYTVASGKTGFLPGNGNGFFPFGQIAGGQIHYYNGSGGNSSITVKVSSRWSGATGTVSNGSHNDAPITAMLSTGQTVVVALSGTGGTLWLTRLEL